MLFRSTRCRTAWQACRTSRTSEFQEKYPRHFSDNSLVLLVLHACHAVLHLVLLGSTGSTRLPANWERLPGLLPRPVAGWRWLLAGEATAHIGRARLLCHGGRRKSCHKRHLRFKRVSCIISDDINRALLLHDREAGSSSFLLLQLAEDIPRGFVFS